MAPLWYADSAPGRSGDSGTPTIVLLHAFPLSSIMWHRLVPLLTPQLRVVQIDLPGLGQSEVPEAGPSMEATAAEVLAVLDRAGIDRAAFFGVSTGGYAALAVAALAPERVGALILGSTTPWLVAPDVPEERREVAEEVEASRSTDALLDSAEAGLGETARREQPELVGLLREVVASAEPTGVAWLARAIAARQDTAGVLAALACPVLLLFGEEDTETPPSRGREMAALRAGGSSAARTTLEVLPGTGHLTALEQPAAVAELLARWPGLGGATTYR